MGTIRRVAVREARSWLRSISYAGCCLFRRQHRVPFRALLYLAIYSVDRSGRAVTPQARRSPHPWNVKGEKIPKGRPVVTTICSDQLSDLDMRPVCLTVVPAAAIFTLFLMQRHAGLEDVNINVRVAPPESGKYPQLTSPLAASRHIIHLIHLLVSVSRHGER